MELPIRKQLRLEGWDYAQGGLYFIIICTHDCQSIFGKVVGNGLDRSAVALTLAGELATQGLEDIPTHFPDVTVEKYVVMPNHIHMILGLQHPQGTERSRPFPTVSTIVGLYKSGVSRVIHRHNPNLNVWQKSFYDHIIRSDKTHLNIWNYIDTNPDKWAEDKYYLSS